MAGLDFGTLVLLGTVSGIWYEWLVRGTQPNTPSYFGIGCVVAALAVFLLKSSGLYRRSFVLNQNGIARILKVWLTVFSLLAIAAFLLKVSSEFSRGALLVYFLTGGAALVGIRWAARGLLRQAINTGTLKARRVLLIGDTRELPIRELGASLKRHGYTLAHSFLFSPDHAGGEANAQLPWKEIINAAKSGDIDEIMLAVHWYEIPQIEKIVSRLRVLPIPIRLLPDQAMSRYLDRPITDIGLTKTIELQREPLRYWERLVKHVFDLVVAFSVLIILSPMLLAVAIFIKLDSPGPVFFRQTRVGFNGRRFRIYKFRTMRTLEDGTEIRQATRNDDRITRVGKWLRASSVDEIPQLINVLLGDMSLVGPRPHAVAHDNHYDTIIADYALRHHVRPGITGWAQVRGLRGETPTVDLMLRRVEHDLWYIHNWSFWLDSLIVARTVLALMRPQNAY